MKLPRRRFLKLVASGAALPTMVRVTRAQVWPSRPVRLVVGFPAGGATDLFARLIGQSLSERFGQPVAIENRVGAGSNIATEGVIRARPDGYTLPYITASNSWNTALYDNLNFDFIRDIVPVASVVRGLGVLVVHPSFPVKTIAEFIAYAKANPGKINMASGGSGSSQHLYGELFKAMTGVNMVHIPYRGGGPALIDLIAGQVPIMFDSIATSLEHIKAGKLRALAVTSEFRSEVLPELPTIGEFVPGYEATFWQGIGAPLNTPVEVLDQLSSATNACLADPKLRARVFELGYSVFASSREEFSKFVIEFTEKWAKVIRAANIKAE